LPTPSTSSRCSTGATPITPLTDCTSIVVMQSVGLVEALTGDRHFTQAGLTAVFGD